MIIENSNETHKTMISLINLLLLLFNCLSVDSYNWDDFSSNKINNNQSLFPLILVPGDGGSQIEAKLNKPSVVHYFCDSHTNDYFTLWINLADVLPYAVDCFTDNMRLVYNNQTRSTSNSPGVETRIPGFGQTETVEYLDPNRIPVTGYYNVLVDNMVNLGYQRGYSIRAAPYDFRKSPRELTDYLVQFKSLIEETTQLNGGLPCIVICHSMGCQLMLYFLVNQSSDWKANYIKSLVALSAPWGGAVKAMKAFASGDNMGVIVVPELKMRRDERTFSSMAFLLPKQSFWPDNQTLIRHGNVSYSTGNYHDFFNDINYDVGYQMWLDVKDLLSELPAPDVEVHCIHGNGINTMDFLNYQSGDFPDAKPEITFGNGDGTVNQRSLEGCLRWRDQQPQTVHYLNLTGIDHFSITADPQVISYLKKIIT